MCQCARCGWPVHTAVQISLVCPRCGAMINCDGQPLQSQETIIETVVPPCGYRSASIGQASCGCGDIYHCHLHKRASGEPLLCGDRIPIDEYVDFQGTMLGPETYRRCPDCPDNTNAAKT